MSKLSVFSIFDVKSEGWTRPIFSQNVETFKRELRDVLASGKDLPFCVHPEDYQAFKIGEWSEVDPHIVGGANPEFVCALVNLAPQAREFVDQASAA